MFLFDVSTEFHKQLKTLFLNKEELYNYLKDHPNKQRAIEKMCDQILIYERKFRTKLLLQQRNVIIKQCVQLFSKAALKAKEQQLMTDIQKHNINPTNDAHEEMKDNILEVDRETGVTSRIA